MKTFRDFLVWYNNKDVYPFIQAIAVQSAMYFDTFGLNFLKDGLSVSGLTLRYLFKSLPSNVFFSLTNNQNGDFHALMRDQIVGGPSIVYHRYHEKGKTRIRDGPNMAQTLLGWDANSLYLSALVEPMATEQPIRRRKDKDFKPQKVDIFGQMAREWLEWTGHQEQVSIRHKFNGHEKALGPRHIRVDGWNGESRTAYQFHGCMWHGHSCHLNQGRTHHRYKPDKSLADLREQTANISKYLVEEVKVNLVEMWECEWHLEKKTNPQIRQFLETHNLLPFKSALKSRPSVENIIDAVENGKLFGMVQCDIRVPDHLKQHFSEMTPIFKNVEVGIDDIGEHMKTHCVEGGVLKRPRRTLVGSYVGEHILLITPLLRWYLKQGLVVDDVQQVVEYRPQACYDKFGDKCTSARRQGDLNSDSSILSDSWKLFANSAYGKSCEALDSHTVVKYAEDPSKLVNKAFFRKLTCLDTDLDEVELAKAKINWNLPIQIGFFVYQYAKLRMLRFYYECVDKFIARENIQLCQMDTDSMYFMISGSGIDSVLKPDTKQEFYETRHSWFPSESCDQHRGLYVETEMAGKPWVATEQCCLDRQRKDKRTPGLFKKEYEGDGIVALCSKTYFCFGEKNKMTSKGLSVRSNNLKKEDYMKVLETKVSSGGVNKGFKTDGVTMFTYEQERMSLSYTYIKRKVSADGISTGPLDI